MTRPNFIATFFLYTIFISLSTQLVAVGVDYGNEYVKVSMVYPGSPLDMVLTPSGQRKFINSITLNGEYRLFGTESRQKLQKNPLYTLDSRISPKDKLNPSFTVKVDDKTRLHWSEVAANLLSHINDQINRPNKSLVMAIPSYYGLGARYILEEAIYLSGFNHLAFVDQGVAAGHALAQSIQKPTTVLIYDLGEDGAKVSVLSITPKNTVDKNLTTVNTLGLGYEPDVGGNFHDRIIRKLVTEKAKDPKLFEYVPLGDYKKRFALSDSVVIAGTGNREFVTLTSEEFNKHIEPSLHLLNNPIVSALEMANKSLSDMESVEIIGGSWRLPVVKSYLEEIIKPHTLSIHLNADEAIAIGSGLISASLSSKPFLSWSELSLYPLFIKCFYSNSPDNPFESIEVFPKGSSLVATEKVTLQVAGDFSISFFDHNVSSNSSADGFPRYHVSLGGRAPPSPPPVQTESGPESRSDEVRGGEAYPKGQRPDQPEDPNNTASDKKDESEDSSDKDEGQGKDEGVYPEERSDEGKNVETGVYPEERGSTPKSEPSPLSEAPPPPIAGCGKEFPRGREEEVSSSTVSITVTRDNKGIQVKAELMVKDKAVALKITQLDLTSSKTLSARRNVLESYIKKDKEYNARAIAYSDLESALYENYSLLDKLNSLKVPEAPNDYAKLKLEHFISEADKNSIKEESSKIEDWLETNGNKANLTDFENRLNKLKSSLAPSKSRQIAFNKWINVFTLLERESNDETLKLYQDIISTNPDDYGKSHESFKEWLDSHFKDVISTGVNNLSTSQLMDGTLKLKKFTEAAINKIQKDAEEAKESVPDNNEDKTNEVPVEEVDTTEQKIEDTNEHTDNEL